ncbi:MAG: response regulator transcription factor [Eubacteriales bacterium]|nr:response regulator transcription factor [Eubacteriales bacterium]
MRLLLVEDDKEISAMLEGYLTAENFVITPAYDGLEALQKFQEESFDLVLLDLMIPKLSGMEVMGKIREKSTVPILIVSAKDSDSDKSLGLGLGADDYITKPFSVTELSARIKANIRRSTLYAAREEDKGKGTVTIGELTLNLDDYSVCRDGINLELTAKEFEILKLLAQNPKKVYTKEQIYANVWQDAYCGDENAVNVHISRLRNKIEDNPRSPRYVVTVWGIGYKLGEII